MEHPTVLRTGSSFHGSVFEEFHFPQGWSSQGLWISLAFWITGMEQQGAGSIGVSPAHRSYHSSTGPLCLGVLHGSQPLPTHVGTATAGQGSISLSHGRDARLGKPDSCCLSVPVCRHSPKAQETSPELFGSNEKQSPVGKGEPRAIPAANSEAMGGHTPRAGRRSQLVPFSSPSALLFHSNKSRGGAGILACFLAEGARGAGTEMLPGCAC